MYVWLTHQHQLFLGGGGGGGGGGVGGWVDVSFAVGTDKYWPSERTF